MLFAFPKPGEHEMWMEDTYIALEQVFINAEQEVTKVVRRVPLDRTLIGSKDTLYVLEVNPGSGIQEGDYLEFDDEIKDWGEYKMKVLAPDGSY